MSAQKGSLGLFAAWLVLQLATAAWATDRPPNVILVMTDDQGYGELGSSGNPAIRTPNLDRLRAESVRLTDFHVNAVCSPTRAALMTGQYASRAGVWHTLGGRDRVRAGVPMMPEVFAGNGYRTLMAGKWHLGDNYPFRPEDRGFDEVYRIGGGSIGQIADYWGNRLVDTHYWNGSAWVKSEGFCTDTQFDAVISFIERNRERPFFIYLPTTAIHSPVGAPDSYLAMYADLDKSVQSFYAMVSNVDANLGRLRRRLSEIALADDTILIFLTDNGTACGRKSEDPVFNAGWRGKKGSLYEGGHRVPCFIYWPRGGLKGGVDVDLLSAHIDLLPTLVEACALKRRKDLALDGLNLMPWLKDPAVPAPDRILVTEAKVNKRDVPYAAAAVMSGPWRLVNGGKELYHVGDDPGQEHDVADDHPEVVQRLRQGYETWYRELEPGFEQRSRTVIGAPHENPSRLTSMDLHPGAGTEKGKVVWNQKGVLQAGRYRGLWALEAAEAGTYEISLRRWPEEAGLTFAETPEKAVKVVYTEARLRVGDIDEARAVDMAAEKVTFTVSLPKGPLELDAVLVDDQGRETSAYYVDVLKVSNAERSQGLRAR